MPTPLPPNNASLVRIAIPWPTTSCLPLVFFLGSWSMFSLPAAMRHRNRLFKTTVTAGMNELFHKKRPGIFLLHSPVCPYCLQCMFYLHLEFSATHNLNIHIPPTYVSMHLHSANIYTRQCCYVTASTALAPQFLFCPSKNKLSVLSN